MLLGRSSSNAFNYESDEEDLGGDEAEDCRISTEPLNIATVEK